jgi:hypothetical protein
MGCGSGGVVVRCPSSFMSVDGGRLSDVRSWALAIILSLEGGLVSSFAGDPAYIRW